MMMILLMITVSFYRLVKISQTSIEHSPFTQRHNEERVELKLHSPYMPSWREERKKIVYFYLPFYIL